MQACHKPSPEPGGKPSVAEEGRPWIMTIFLWIAVQKRTAKQDFIKNLSTA
jgi:hypothetical protein